MARKVVYVPLMGGLGNQLFQLSAALNQTKGKVIVIPKIGSPKCNMLGKPEIFDFKLPDFIEIYDRRCDNLRVVKKTFNLALKSGLILDKIMSKVKLKSLVTIFASVLFSLHLRRPIVCFINNGIGFSPIANRANFLIGYFQSHLFASRNEVYNSLYNLRVKNKSLDLMEIEKEWKSEKILLVHIRLGDYKSHPHFGIPDKQYYGEALQIMFRDYDFTQISLFSDEPNKAIEFIPKRYKHLVVRIGDVNESSTCTLESMRYAHGYILANSTFGWWAAYLSFCKSSPVIVPKPWFKSLNDPIHLKPLNWLEVSAR